MSFLAAIGGALSLGSSLLGGKKSTEGYQVDQRIVQQGLDVLAKADPEKALELASESGDLARLIAQPDSPKYRRLAGLYEAFNRQAALAAMEDILRSNRRSKSRGGPGFFANPDRRDEARSKSLLYNYMLGRQQSGVQAQRALGAASQGVGNAATRTTQATGLYPQIAGVIMQGAGTGSSARQGEARNIAEMGGAAGRAIGAMPEEFGLFQGEDDWNY